MMADLLKHQSLSKISNSFVTNIAQKYNRKVLVGEYIIERFISKKVDLGFRSNQERYTPFFACAKKFSNFNINVNNCDKTTGQAALRYSRENDNIGLLLSTATFGFSNILESLDNAEYYQAPVFLMSFYDPETQIKISDHLRSERRYLKVHHTINDSQKLPNILEYLIFMSELPKKGPVHLNICNSIIEKEIDFDSITTLE